jgi:hypothetical protein
VISNIQNFDYDYNVSVFETNIRILGGLLSAHLLGMDKTKFPQINYSGELLPLAIDLGKYLLEPILTVKLVDYSLRSILPQEFLMGQYYCNSSSPNSGKSKIRSSAWRNYNHLRSYSRY